MSTHLSETEITSALCGQEISAAANEHLQRCISCRSRIAEFERAVTLRRAGMEGESPDWQKQRRAVLDRLPEQIGPRRRRSPRWMRPALAAAAVVTIALAAGLLHNPATPDLMPTPHPELPIEQILAQTELLLADDSIPGFEVFGEINDADLDAVLPARGAS